MLNVLLESRAPRTRRVGGTLASTFVHGALMAGAVMLTVQPSRVNATDAPKTRPIIYVPLDRKPEAPRPHAPVSHQSSQTTVAPPAPAPVLKFNGPDVPVIHDVVPSNSTATPEEFGSGIQTTGPIGAPSAIGTPGGVVDEHLVDRSPRIIGTPVQPAFPSALRQSGRGGRVLVQFVIDTTGRAEMDGFKVMETSDPLFAESVRNVLPRYRFSAGEAGGRKVRTLVQLPFDFTLLR